MSGNFTTGAKLLSIIMRLSQNRAFGEAHHDDVSHHLTPEAVRGTLG
jgi:hypothetical protein